MSQCVEWAIIAAKDETEDILGWVKMCRYFAKHLVCAIPIHDQTRAILEHNAPDVRIVPQFHRAGWSDIECSHRALEFWVNYFVNPGEWCLLMACDERFNPQDWPKISAFVRAIQPYYNGIYCETMHMFWKDESHCMDFYDNQDPGSFLYLKFLKQTGYWHKGAKAHSGYDLPSNMVPLPWPFYHYCFVKNTRVPFGNGRDQEWLKDCPLYELENPIKNWRDLD